jgi:hypothetical protein
MRGKREESRVNAAVAYCRVSTQEQVRGGVSLDAQTERLRAYCRAAGLELVELVREEGVTAPERSTSDLAEYRCCPSLVGTVFSMSSR